MSNLTRASSDEETDYTMIRMVEWQSHWTKHPDFFSGLIRGCVAPVRGRSVLWVLYPWHKVIEIQLAYWFGKSGDARKVSLGQQTFDTDGTAPLCHNNSVHNGQSEDRNATVSLPDTRSGLACLTHRCIMPGLPHQEGDRVDGLEVDRIHRLCLTKISRITTHGLFDGDWGWPCLPRSSGFSENVLNSFSENVLNGCSMKDGPDPKSRYSGKTTHKNLHRRGGTTVQRSPEGMDNTLNDEMSTALCFTVFITNSVNVKFSLQSVPTTLHKLCTVLTSPQFFHSTLSSLFGL